MGMIKISSHTHVANHVSRRELYYGLNHSDSPEILPGAYSYATSHCSTKSLRVTTSGAGREDDMGNRDPTRRLIPLPAGKRAVKI